MALLKGKMDHGDFLTDIFASLDLLDLWYKMDARVFMGNLRDSQIMRDTRQAGINLLKKIQGRLLKYRDWRCSVRSVELTERQFVAINQ